jgi:hypothetical protein
MKISQGRHKNTGGRGESLKKLECGMGKAEKGKLGGDGIGNLESDQLQQRAERREKVQGEGSKLKVQSSRIGRWEKAGRLRRWEVWRMRSRERLKLVL